jgi:Glyoxalase/Bleomycin resistance protein/Dioxygenase superfamily
MQDRDMSTSGSTARPTEGLFTAPRPVDVFADLFANIWQLGYVTTDRDRALEVLSGRFGLTHHFVVPSGEATFMAGDQVVPWEAKFAMAARGGLIVEIIEPVSGEVGFYNDALPGDGSFAIRLHHLAAFMETGDAAWDRAKTMLEKAGLKFDYTMVIPGRVRAGYIDAREDLGHFLEVCQLDTGDLDFFSSLIADSA